MTFGLVDVGYSLSKEQAVKLIFFAPCYHVIYCDYITMGLSHNPLVLLILTLKTSQTVCREKGMILPELWSDLLPEENSAGIAQLTLGSEGLLKVKETSNAKTAMSQRQAPCLVVCNI